MLGTLFEWSMARGERRAGGAHFTTEEDILRIVVPSIVSPWRARIAAATTAAEVSDAHAALARFRVLDPACGCGNFLYVAYRELRRVEHDLVATLAERPDRPGPAVPIRQFCGIDTRPLAVEIAKLTMVIAERLADDELGHERRGPGLADLDGNFIVGDALRVDWPAFDVCIGNPPFLGRRRIVAARGAAYSAWLAHEFPDVGGVSDYAVYWFRKAHELLPDGGRAGLVGTNTIRQTTTRKAGLDHIVDTGGVIYDAVSSQPWSGDANVHVSIVNWIKNREVDRCVLWMGDGTVHVGSCPGSPGRSRPTSTCGRRSRSRPTAGRSAASRGRRRGTPPDSCSRPSRPRRSSPATHTATRWCFLT